MTYCIVHKILRKKFSFDHFNKDVLILLIRYVETSITVNSILLYHCRKNNSSSGIFSSFSDMIAWLCPRNTHVRKLLEIYNEYSVLMIIFHFVFTHCWRYFWHFDRILKNVGVIVCILSPDTLLNTHVVYYTVKHHKK